MSIIGNRIGTAPSGFPAAANSGDGVSITEGDNNVIGGSTTAERNVISGNGQHGVDMEAGVSGNQVRGNYIGIDSTGTTAVGNVGAGIVMGGPNTQVGGATAGERNVISGNVAGILFDSGAGFAHDGSTVYGNYIGTNAAGTGAVANGRGLLITQGGSAFGSGPSIGNNGLGQTNVISGNTGDGIEFQVSGQPREFVGVSNNRIGLQADGTSPLPNGDDGIDADDSDDLEIAFNTIAANGGTGVRLRGSSLSNNVQGNSIGVDVLGGPDANGSHGVVIEDTAANNQIGGTGGGQGNVIAFNADAGVSIEGSGDGNVVRANQIRLNNDLGITFDGSLIPGQRPVRQRHRAQRGAERAGAHQRHKEWGRVDGAGHAGHHRGHLHRGRLPQPVVRSIRPRRGRELHRPPLHELPGTGEENVAARARHCPGRLVRHRHRDRDGRHVSVLQLRAGDGRAPGGGGGDGGDEAAPHGRDTVAQTSQEPTRSKTTNVQPVSGKVLVKVPGSSKFVELKAGGLIPIGSTVDTPRAG